MRKNWIVNTSRGTLFYLLIAGTLPNSATSQDRTITQKQASIIFRGTVEKKGEVSFKGVPASNRTVVVLVEQVIQKPPAVSFSEGDRVTVDALNAAALSTGSTYIFYANGWIYGAGVAVREIGHETFPAHAAEKAATQSGANRTQNEISDSELRSSLEVADTVVIGTVSAVHPWNPPVAVATRPRISEHAAKWQEAIIKVETTLKGAPEVHEVVVRFPGTWDLAWASIPKLLPGQSGTFILQKDRITGAPMATLQNKSVSALTALKAADVLPVSEAPRVRSLLQK